MTIGKTLIQTKYKSKLEKQFAATFKLPYEKDKIKYTIVHTYNPDWTIADNVYLETKGIWDSADRTKIRTVLNQNPNIIIAMVFQNSKAKIYKGSKSTYADFCDKHLIRWFDSTDTTGIQTFINEHSN